jgi:signal transduction histidine kinase
MPTAHPSGDDAPVAPQDGPGPTPHPVPAQVAPIQGRWLAALAVVGSVALLLLALALARAPTIDARWQAEPDGALRLVSSDDERLAAHAGRRLVGLTGAGPALAVDASLLQAKPRWTPDGERRAALVAARQALDTALQAPQVALRFDDGATAMVEPARLGWRGLGALFWLVSLPALLLALLGLHVWLTQPQAHTALFALMAAAQACTLVWLGVDLVRGLTALPAWIANDLAWRLMPDLALAAAAVHLFAVHPVRLRQAAPVAGAAWTLAAGALLVVALGAGASWWIGQGAVALLAAASVAVLQRSHRQLRHPFSGVLRRLAWVVIGGLVAMQAAVIAAAGLSAPPHAVVETVVLAWGLFLASLLAWVPFLSRGRQLLPEFAVLGGLGSIAASLHLLLFAGLRLDAVTSVTLAMALSLAFYAAARRWLLRPLGGRGVLSTEHAFEQLYDVARELAERPQHHVALLARLLTQLFDPIEVRRIADDAHAAHVLDDGASLAVPVHSADERHEPAGMSVVLRFARQGERLFTREDARLADRIAEQLRRVAVYDRAVERGRSEERMRIAQDLHDDIGARLLTLMYKAQDPEIEDYLRHTLQDLKTLTRGLAAADHRLSHSVAEWKADIQQRLGAAHVELGWSFAFNDDPELGVVQWSALTRVLRELVSNAIYHARATRVEIDATLAAGTLRLTVADDGIGRDPQAWSHGLGLGGVRKRVKLLGGDVAWRENGAQGIVCEVRIPDLFRRA